MQSSREVAYDDFEIEIGLGIGREYPIAVLHSAAGEAREMMHFPYDELALENRLLSLQNALLRSGGKRRLALSSEEQIVQDFGKELWNALLTGEVRNRYDVSLERANRDGKGLRLKLRIQEPKLASIPWEFMYEPRQSEYLCLSRNTSLVRYLELPQPFTPLAVEPPLRILGMAVSPTDLHQLDLAREKQRVEEAIKSLQESGLVELIWLQGQTWRDLQEAVQTGVWHIFYFIGHGGFDSNTDEGLIALADEKGKTQRFRATHLGRMLAGHRSLRLVILNSCEGAKGSEYDIFSGTASILVRRGIPAVLAMQYEITDRAAIEFARAFYRALSNGLSVDAAVTEARMAVSFAVENTIEWGTPVLYMRSPDGVLFNIQKKGVNGKKRVKEPKDQKEAERPEQERREQKARQAELSALYSKGMEALTAQDWQMAVKQFKKIIAINADFRDANARLKEAEQRLNIASEKEKTLKGEDERKELEKLEKKRRDIELKEKAAKKAEQMEHREDVWENSKDMRIIEMGTPIEIRHNSIGMEFALIREGEFMMGSEEDDTEKPMHRVRIRKPFYLGVYPVTQREWKEVMGYAPSIFKGDDLPIENVSWKNVQEFIKKLNEKENTDKYRLPSEAEWEYAAHAGTKTIYNFGEDESLDDYAWYAKNSGSRPPKKGDYFGYDKDDYINNKWNGKTHPVGKKKPNPWGLYDMQGNVWEWVKDRWHDNFNGAPEDGSAWEGDDTCPVFRGRSWRGVAKKCKQANRSKGDGRDYHCYAVGFRLLRDL